ncbi:MAG: hypothetical protein ACP5FL_03360 [Thermoplasmatota archaeon]
MKRFLAALVILLFLPLAPIAVEAESGDDASITIREPTGGIYYHGSQLAPDYAPFWTLILGTHIQVTAETTGTVISVSFILYDVRSKEVIDKTLDITPADGFSCIFHDVPAGTYLLAAMALVADIEEPVASDWRTPVFVFPM